MKKISQTVGLIMLLSSANFLGAQSKKDAIPQKVAVFSVYVNTRFSESGFTAMARPGESTTASKDYRFYPQIRNTGYLPYSQYATNLKDKIFQIANSFPFELVNEEEVITKNEYRSNLSLPGYAMFNRNNLCPGGYIAIPYSDRTVIKNGFTYLPESDGIMICDVSFTIVNDYRNGNEGKVSVSTNLNLQVFNKDGKKCFKTFTSGRSAGFIHFLYSEMFDEEQLNILCIQAMEVAMERMAKKIEEQKIKLGL